MRFWHAPVEINMFRNETSVVYAKVGFLSYNGGLRNYHQLLIKTYLFVYFVVSNNVHRQRSSPGRTAIQHGGTLFGGTYYRLRLPHVNVTRTIRHDYHRHNFSKYRPNSHRRRLSRPEFDTEVSPFFIKFALHIDY